MISSIIGLAAAALAMQASDTTRASREAYTGCLRQLVDHAIEEQMSQEAFDAALPQRCGAQEAALRAAVIARDHDQESADMAIEDARANWVEQFQYAMEPVRQREQEQAQAAEAAQAAQAAQTQAGQQPEAQPAAQQQPQ